MTRRILTMSIVIAISTLLACCASSAKQDAQKKHLEWYFWDNQAMSLDSVTDYKMISVVKITTSNSLQKTNTSIDTINVLGKGKMLYSSTKDNNFYTDNKYFFFFYPEKKSMYGESSKDKTMQFHCNVLQLLKYAKENMINYSVDSSSSLNTIILINLPDDNILNTNKIEIKASSAGDRFKIKNINYVAKSKTFNQVQTSKANIDIINYCFKCNDTVSLDPANFYTETNGKITLKGKFSDYELEKFWQW